MTKASLPFFNAVVLAQRAHLMHFRGRLVRDCDIDRRARFATRPATLSTSKIINSRPNSRGRRSARALGYEDPFYLHDKDGARIR